ncbi:MAG: PQQ-like beta-propeller repeat protein [Pirellulaceae bacterium]
MKTVLAALVSLVLVAPVLAQDWPQWRGPGRDAVAKGFEVPSDWPENLTKKWSTEVGDGVATPALVGDRLYVHARQGGDEVIRCLDAATGEEIWQNKYATPGVGGAASGFPGPRCSPAVAEGKVVTLGVHGTTSCLDAETGKVLWRKNDYEGAEPRFATSASPMIVDGLAVFLLGDDRRGGLVAYDLASGEAKWKWEDDGAAYASPVLMTVNGVKSIVTPTAGNLAIVALADGKTVWMGRYTQGRYNATTPLVIGETVIYAGEGEGTTAEKFFKKDDEYTSEYVWQNGDNSLMYNSPVLKEKHFYGLSNANKLFCVDVTSGKTTWSADLPSSDDGGGGRGRGRGGYGSVVDAGSVLVALSPAGNLVVYEADAAEYKQLAVYKVASGGTYAYPVLSGNRIFIKDSDAVTLWTVE